MCPHGILCGLELRIVGDHLHIAFPIEVLNLDVGLARIFASQFACLLAAQQPGSGASRSRVA
jgi:hypothetical protein